MLWKTLSSRTVYRNRWLSVREDQVIRPDGQEGIYGVVEVRDSVGVAAINERDEIALVGQWRYPHWKYSWEIPRGGTYEGENDLLAAAKRELREEAGVEADDWELILAVDVGNGLMNEVQRLYVAKGLRMVPAENDPEEEIAVKWVPFDEAARMAMNGEITCVCSVAAILKVALLRV